jgi:hypothetical protein
MTNVKMLCDTYVIFTILFSINLSGTINFRGIGASPVTRVTLKRILCNLSKKYAGIIGNALLMWMAVTLYQDGFTHRDPLVVKLRPGDQATVNPKPGRRTKKETQ